MCAPIVIPARLQERAGAVIDRVNDGDRAFFKRNPARVWRWRRFVEGEDCYQVRFDTGRDPSHVLVVRVQPGARVREFCNAPLDSPAPEWAAARARELRSVMRGVMQASVA